MKMFKKKTQKWFDIQGVLLEKRWAKTVTLITPVRFNQGAMGANYNKPWYFYVIGSERLSCEFATEKEAMLAWVPLVKWIKDIQE